MHVLSIAVSRNYKRNSVQQINNTNIKLTDY